MKAFLLLILLMSSWSVLAEDSSKSMRTEDFIREKEGEMSQQRMEEPPKMRETDPSAVDASIPSLNEPGSRSGTKVEPKKK